MRQNNVAFLGVRTCLVAGFVSRLSKLIVATHSVGGNFPSLWDILTFLKARDFEPLVFLRPSFSSTLMSSSCTMLTFFSTPFWTMLSPSDVFFVLSIASGNRNCNFVWSGRMTKSVGELGRTSPHKHSTLYQHSIKIHFFKSCESVPGNEHFP